MISRCKTLVSLRTVGQTQIDTLSVPIFLDVVGGATDDSGRIIVGFCFCIFGFNEGLEVFQDAVQYSLTLEEQYRKTTCGTTTTKFFSSIAGCENGLSLLSHSSWLAFICEPIGTS